MTAQCHLTWDSYKKNICEGFSHLQQQEELVDMTLAAEGHLVKVHKTLLALASPYLKSIIQSAPCQHPVVFLTNLKHHILGYILEFVYTGEVELPVNDITDFIEASKALHINGACDLTPPIMKRKASQSKNTGLRYDQDKHKKNGNRNIEYIGDKSIDDYNLNTGSNLPYQEVDDDDIEDFTDSTPIVSPPFQNTAGNNLNRNIEDKPQKTMDDYILNTEHSKINTNLTYQAVVDDFEDLIDSQVDSNPISSLPITINTTGYYNLNNTETLVTSKDSISGFRANNTDDFIKSQFKELNPNIGNKTTELNTENKNIPTDECEPQDQVNNLSDDMDIDVGCTSHLPCEDKSDTNMVNVDSTQNNNYSINVEMPVGNEAPPKITIQAEVLQNFPITRDSVSNKRIQGVGKEMTSSNSIPNITIDVTKIPDVSSANTAKDSNILVNTDITESASNVFSTPYYIMSSKGSLQIILNRFIYGLHHQAHKGKKMRWRCIDYRHLRCPAYIDTSGELVVSRQFSHCHGFHDDKIINRGSSKKIYDSLQDILRAQAENNNKGEIVDVINSSSACID